MGGFVRIVVVVSSNKLLIPNVSSLGISVEIRSDGNGGASGIVEIGLIGSEGDDAAEIRRWRMVRNSFNV